MGKTYLGSSSTAGVVTAANETSYWPLGGIMKKSATEANRNVLFRLPGTLSNLYIRVITNSIAATSTFLTRKNGTTDGANTVSIGSTATGEFTDTTHSDTVVAGDKWSYKFVPGAATNTMTFVIHSCIFEASRDTVTRTIAGNDLAQTTASTTWFLPLCGDTGANVTTETNAKERMRKAGTLKNGCARVVNARATTTTVKSRKNAADGTIAISCTGGASGYYEDTTHSDTVGVGEDWNWSLTTGTGTDQLDMLYVAADFVSTADIGLVGLSHMTTVAYTDGTTNFTKISGTHNTTTTEANTKADCRIAGDYSELTCLVTQNDLGAGINTPIKLRKNGVDTTLSISCTGNTTGVFSDSVNTVTLVSTDEVNYSIVPPAVAGTHTISITNFVMNIKSASNYVETLGTETVVVGESLARLLAAIRAPATETTTIGESLVRVKGLNRALGTETTTIGESMAIRQTLNRSFPETTVIGESLTRLLAANRALSTETTTVGESLVRVKGVIRALATETVTISEVSLNRLLAATRAPATETTTVGESLTRLLAANRSLATETVVIGDNLTRVKGVIRTLTTETVVVDESLNRMLAANRALGTETTTVGDSLARTRGIMRALSTETVVVGESLARMLAATRALSTETTTIGESLNRTRGVNRALGTETVTVGESLNRMLAANRSLTIETVTVGESLTRLLAAIRALSDTTTLSENLSYVFSPGGEGPNKIRALSDTVVIGESIARMIAANRALTTEVTAISESLNRQLAANRALSDTTVIGESLTKLRTVVRSIATETISIGESLTRRFTGTRPLVETTAITDSLTKLLTQLTIPTQLKSVVQWLRAKYSISTPPKDPSY